MQITYIKNNSNYSQGITEQPKTFNSFVVKRHKIKDNNLNSESLLKEGHIQLNNPEKTTNIQE